MPLHNQRLGRVSSSIKNLIPDEKIIKAEGIDAFVLKVYFSAADVPPLGWSAGLNRLKKSSISLEEIRLGLNLPERDLREGSNEINATSL